MRLFRHTTVEASVVHHPKDVAACRGYLGEDEALLWVACWDRATTRLVAAASVHRVGDADTGGRIPADLLPQTRRVRGLGGQPEALAAAVYRQGLVDDVELWLWTVEEVHVREAVRLGFRPWGPADRAATPSFVPMVLVVHDQAHLDVVRSPFAEQLRRAQLPLSDAGPRWYRRLAWPGGTSISPEDRPRPQGGQDVEVTEEIARNQPLGLQG